MDAFLHIPTLLITSSIAGLCICVSLVLIWRSSRAELCVLSWGGSYGLVTLATVLLALRGHISNYLSIDVANGALLLSFGLAWLGYRQFTRRTGRHDRLVVMAGLLVWLVYSQTGPLFADINRRLVVIAVIQVIYLAAVARDLIDHAGKEPLPAIGLTVVAMATQAVMLILRMSYSLIKPMDPLAVMVPNTLFVGLALIASTVFAVFLGLLQLGLVGQRSEMRYRKAAETDELTGLANRRHFLDCILPALAAPGDSDALIIFDIDHFKRINDTHGHLIGDRALAAFGEILRAERPEGSVAARIGGEEFALYLPKADARGAAVVAERIRKLTADLRFSPTFGDLQLSVSCGVAGTRDTGRHYEALHGAADSALYAAKRAGRDQVSIYRWRPVPAVAGRDQRSSVAML